MVGLSTLCGASGLSGVASYVFYFSRPYEHYFYPVNYLAIFLLTIAGSLFGLTQAVGLSFGSASLATSAVATTYLVGVYSSLLIYRLFLNPLNRFPGPPGVQISSLAWCSQLGGADCYHQLKALHDKHGKFVRIGSSDLSIIDPEGMQIAYGANAKATKGSWYSGDDPLVSMHTTRDRVLHDKRRRVWAPAFSDKALREYETTLGGFNDKVIQKFHEFKGEPIDVTKWFMLYSFDVMGRLAFGKDYGMLDSGEKHYALQLMTEGMESLAIMPPTWLFKLLSQIPGLAAGYKKFCKFCADETTWRVKNNVKKEGGGGDILGWILKAYTDVAHPEKDTYLQADTRLIIVAGSDTTSATLGYLFFHLALEPEQQEKVRKEVRAATKGEWNDKTLNSLPMLNGAINEAMRLHPPVPSGVQRLTPKEGMMIGETYVPGHVNFWMPQYVIGRQESIYTNADSFIPERWSSKPEMIKHKDAFAPFSMGPYGCIGKNLAYMELRTLTTRLLLEFEVRLAPGEDGSRLMTKTKDHFTVSPGECDLTFTALKE